MINPNIFIKKFRQQKNISQYKMAKELNISQSFISEVESGRKSITVRMLFKIAAYLDVCPCQLLDCTINCRKCTKLRTEVMN